MSVLGGPHANNHDDASTTRRLKVRVIRNLPPRRLNTCLALKRQQGSSSSSRHSRLMHRYSCVVHVGGKVISDSFE